MSGAAARQDGKMAAGDAQDGKEASGTGGKTFALKDLGNVGSDTEKFVKVFLQQMFSLHLHVKHGSKFDSSKNVDMAELLDAIHDCVGCKMHAVDLCYAGEDRIDAFNQFVKDRDLTHYVAFHGTNPQAAADMCNNGINAAKCKRGKYGKGTYFANSRDGTLALAFADTADANITDASTYSVVVAVVAAPKCADDVPVGTEMQEDFGLLHKNRYPVFDNKHLPYDNHVLTDPHRCIFCVNNANAVMPTAVMHFKYDLAPPRDDVLLYSWFPCRLWQKLKELYPDIVKHKKELVKRHHARQRLLSVIQRVREHVRATKAMVGDGASQKPKRKKTDVRALWQKVRDFTFWYQRRASQPAGGHKKLKLK